MSYSITQNPSNKRSKGVIVDYRTNKKSVRVLKECGLNVVFSTPINSLYDAVNGHPDMQIHYLGDKKFICAKEAFGYYTNELPADAQIVCAQTALKSEYPYDVLYNAAVIGNYVICNSRYTAPEILAEYNSMGKKILNVNQGYTKCSIAVINSNSAITSDEGIYNVLKTNGIEVLKITPGSIKLDGVSYGFIGGTCGLIASNVLAVNGNIRQHPDYDEIYDFCKNRNVDILELNDEYLYDIGSILSFS